MRKSTNINKDQEIETVIAKGNNVNAKGGLELGINEQDLLQDDDKGDAILSRDITPRKEIQCAVERTALSRDVSQSSSSSLGKRVSSHRGAIPKLLLERQRSGAMNNNKKGTRRVEPVEASTLPHTSNTRFETEDNDTQLSIAVTNSEDEPRHITPDEKQHPPSDKEIHDLALDTAAESDQVEVSSPDKEKSFDCRYEVAWRRNIEGVYYTFCFRQCLHT